MKRTIIAAVLIAAFQFSFAQVNNSDPSVSVHNYKHPNKAAYAKKNKLDKNTELKTVEVNRNDNYKHSASNKKISKRAALVPTSSGDKGLTRRSYKHPYGL
ncbi:MAG: type IV pilin N-terminal domain-containing protein [Cytophagaceae bacterium]|nr:type IV pilin N-terminal domain-containing protein [Cytophagaceae bacterium]